MSPIPDDHQAARDLHRQFLELGEADARGTAARRRSVPALPRHRPALVAIAILGGLASAAGAAKVFVIDSGIVKGDSKAPPNALRAPQDAALSPLRVRDPFSGPPWGARTYISRTGQQCIVVGRVRAGRLGVVRATRFVPLGADAPGSCSPRGQVQISTSTYLNAKPYHSVLFGLVGRDVRSITVVRRGGRRERLPIAVDGVYLKVLLGASAFRGATVEVVSSSGTARRRLR